MYIISNEDALEIIKIVGGDQAASIAQKLLKKPGLTDEELASSLGMDVKQVRKVLHLLNDLSLVSYEQTFNKKENKRVFKWRLQPEQVIGVAKNQASKILERLKMMKEHISTNQFYWCGNEKCRKYTFEEALSRFFACPSCGNKMNFHDHSRMLEAIDRKISELERLVK